MHIRLSQHLHTTYWSQNSTVLEKGYQTEDAAIWLTDSVFKSINQKMNVEEFSVIWQRFWIVRIMKFVS